MEEIVTKIVRQTFSKPPAQVEAIVGKGKNNQVFRVSVDDKTHILRLHKSLEQLDLYEKERWCAVEASKAGVLTPKIMDTGFCDDWSYQFQEYIKGVHGIDATTHTRLIWFTLGKYAKSFHQIPNSEFQINYSTFVSDLFKNDLFSSKSILPTELSDSIKKRLEETCAWSFSPTLCHGNLHPSNVIVGDDDAVWLIDWETATGNRNPHADLSEIYTWKNGKENIAEFCRGYDLSPDQVSLMMRDIQTLILLRLADVVRRKIMKSDDWINDGYITEMKDTFSKITDFQADILFTRNL